jgi:List-Bact-rpt repeat protein
MRSSIGVLVLVFLSACGGGDGDVTNPPAPRSFTLTVRGQGPGSGRIVSSQGTSPAVDCTLGANGQVSGLCSGTYAEGTSVGITVTPDAGSTFTGWTGDAASCGAEATCSLAMTQNRSAVAQLTSAAPPTASVEIVSDTFYLEPGFGSNGAVIWVAEVRNTTSQIVQSAELNFASHDAAGNILASALSFVGPIPPGETRATQSFADYFGSEASVDIFVNDVRFTVEDPGFSAVRIVSNNWRADPGFGSDGAVIWAVEVENTSTFPLESAGVSIVTYDATGQILTTSMTFVGPIPAGQRRSSQSFADYRGAEANAIFQIAHVR